jgi:hypothetical protein
MAKTTVTEKINNKTGNKVTTKVTRDGSTVHVEKTLKKSDGIFGSRVCGTEKTLSSKTIKRS